MIALYYQILNYSIMSACETYCCCCCCCRQIYDAVSNMLKVQGTIKIYYIILMIFFIVPGIFIFFFLYNWTGFRQFFGSWLHCPQSSGSETYQCIGSSSIFRLSLSLVCLFGLMTFFMLCKNKCSQIVNQGMFWTKYLLVIILFVVFLFVNNNIFSQYAQAGKYISIAFMIIESLILIDLFYLAGIKIKQENNKHQIEQTVHKNYSSQTYPCLLLFFSIIIQSMVIFLNVYGYILFTNFKASQACESSSSTLWVNIVTSFIILILCGILYFNYNRNNNMLTMSLISLYITYLSLIGQFSFPNLKSNLVQCSRFTTNILVMDIIISSFIFLLSLYGSVIGGSGQIQINIQENENKSIRIGGNPPQQPVQLNNVQKNHQFQSQNKIQTKNTKQMTNQQRYTQSWEWVKWHIYMVLSSIYIGQLITNWNSVSIIQKDITPSYYSFWIRIVFSWFVALIYIWTTIAPKILKSNKYISQ